MAEGVAHARAALAGNPSDGFGGAVLAVTLDGLRAHASACPAPQLEVFPESALVRATVTRLALEHAPEACRSEVQWSTSIPRHVGLGGSSAIVIATLRAVCSLHGLTLPAAEMASLALDVEVHDLGIAAGLQDRVAQAYGGLTFMDFAPEAGPHAYESLDRALLPPMMIAWREDDGGDSGAVHGPLKDRHADGDPVVIRSMGELATLARQSRAALLTGDLGELYRCVNQSFEARRRMLDLDPRHVEMIDCARGCGAAANYTGSGGAVVALCPDADTCSRTEKALLALGCQTL